MSALQVQNKQDVLMDSLIAFYQNELYMNRILPIITGKSYISLRIIDWFVTNYSKKNNISYVMDNRQFIVFLNYKSQLKAYTKKQFDPFCRRNRIEFYYEKASYFTTTVGQLNFFRWAVSNKILDYIEKHVEEIENDMNTCIRKIYKKSNNEKKGGRRKRTEISKSATNTIRRHTVGIDLIFT